MVAKERPSLITNVPPSYAVKSVQDGHAWLEAKRIDDNVDHGLWRIQNHVYDLREFAYKHPGGETWIEMTKGHDITELFLTHHLDSEKMEPLLKKYRVAETTKPRNCKLTFEENGFYMTLRRRVVAALPEIKKRTKVYSKFYIDGLFLVTLFLAILTQRYQSVLLAFICSIFYTWTGVSGHNFFHQRDNYRMRYFNLLLMSYRDWRISHVFSHHIYPNSLLDCEIIMFEPIFVWLPCEKSKNFIQRYVSYIYAPFAYSIVYPLEFTKKIYNSITVSWTLEWDDFWPFIIPFIMYYFGDGHSLFDAWKFFAIIILFGGLAFGVIGFNAGHHHPEVVHDGDAVREGFDWGIYSIDTIMDRQEIRGNTLLALTNFGDHALHHLFPALDHGLLPSLYPILFKTLLEFEADCKCYPWFFETVKGQFLQLSRTEKMKLSSHERYLLKTGKTSKLNKK